MYNSLPDCGPNARTLPSLHPLRIAPPSELKATQLQPTLGTLMRSSSRPVCMCHTRISAKAAVAKTCRQWHAAPLSTLKFANVHLNIPAHVLALQCSPITQCRMLSRISPLHTFLRRLQLTQKWGGHFAQAAAGTLLFPS